MANIIVSGCTGAMGKVLTKLIKQHENCDIVAGFAEHSDFDGAFPVYQDPIDCKEKSDVVIDFSHPDLIEKLLDYCKNTSTPIVICTTGFSQLQIDKITECSKYIPIFFSFNMSLGVNLLCRLCQKAVQVLHNDFDIEIVEKHHNQKLDSPSGTAFMIANSINSSVNRNYDYIYGRGISSAKRNKNDIGIHSVRGGTIVGEHEVIFSGHDETLTISHTALSKDIFARGAINSALFIKGKPSGLYDMSSIIK